MNSKKILICAAATAMCSIGLAQASGAGGGATGGTGGSGTSGRSAAPSQNNMGPNQPSGTYTGTAVPPSAGGPDVYVRPPQQRDTAGTMPPRATNPNKPLPPVGTVEPRPNPTTNPSSASGSGGTGVVPLPNAAAPSGPPIVTSPGGPTGFQNQPLPGGITGTGTGTATPTRGEFGGPTDPTVNATPNNPVNSGIDASQVDVTTGRTQTPAMQPPVAQPAGATMPPSTQPANLSAPAGETQPRPSIPMPPPTTPMR